MGLQSAPSYREIKTWSVSLSFHDVYADDIAFSVTYRPDFCLRGIADCFNFHQYACWHDPIPRLFK